MRFNKGVASQSDDFLPRMVKMICSFCISIYMVAILIFFVITVSAAEFRVYRENAPMLLIDIPGVDWTGSKREGDWGALLSLNAITIYVQHEGSVFSKEKWDTASYDHVIKLSDNNEQQLSPAIRDAANKGKSVHIIIDKNITFSRHVTIGKTSEDKWAARVADHALMAVPSNYFKILAMHSNGTITPAYMKNAEKINYAIIASPRGEEGLHLAVHNRDMPVDIITGVTDAPSWRWQGSKGNLLKENPNLRILELQDKGSFEDTHSKLQNTMYKGTWKILQGNTKKETHSGLGEMLSSKINMYSSLMTSAVPTYWTYAGQPQSLSEAQTMSETVRDKHKVLIVGKGTEADVMYKNMATKLGQSNVKRIDQYTDDRTLQLEARKFGADVILGVKSTSPTEAPAISHGNNRKDGTQNNGDTSQTKPGGVLMAPQLKSSGKADVEIKKKILQSRPSGDSMSWPAGTSKGESK